MATKNTETNETVENAPVQEQKKAYTIDEKTLKKSIVAKVEKSGKEKIYLPVKEDEEEGAYVPVSICGVIYQVMKGVEVEVPKAVASILRRSMPKPNKKQIKN